MVQVINILKNVDNVNKETWFKQLPEERSPRTTEGGHNIVSVNSKMEVRRNFFSQRMTEKWNALLLNLKSCKSVKEFRALLMRAYSTSRIDNQRASEWGTTTQYQHVKVAATRGVSDICGSILLY